LEEEIVSGVIEDGEMARQHQTVQDGCRPGCEMTLAGCIPKSISTILSYL
jgi:hypothetical protein